MSVLFVWLHDYIACTTVPPSLGSVLLWGGSLGAALLRVGGGLRGAALLEGGMLEALMFRGRYLGSDLPALERPGSEAK